jgi:hypothetical protein
VRYAPGDVTSKNIVGAACSKFKNSKHSFPKEIVCVWGVSSDVLEKRKILLAFSVM